MARYQWFRSGEARAALGLVCVFALTQACGSDDNDGASSSGSGSGTPGATGVGGGATASSSGSGGSTSGSGTGSGTGGSAACPASCDDAKACTIDMPSGDAASCMLTCEYEEITACADGDGCCPSGCDVGSDDDCTATTITAIPEDRRSPWNPGIPGGIPSRSEICETIDAAQYGDGSTDATNAIQGAIDDCPDDQVVHLPAGEYRLSDALQISSSVVLRGDGPGQTRLVLESGDAVVRIGYGAPNNVSGVAVTSGYTKGSTELTLSDASDFGVGDVVLIDQLEDPDLVVTGDCTFFKRTQGGNRSLGQIFEIVSKDGNTVQVSSPLYVTYQEGLQPELSQTSPNGTVKYAGVEDLYATRTSAGGGFMFHLIDAAYSWVKNVHGEKVDGRHVSLETCYRCVVRDSYFHDAFEILPGGTAYGIAFERHASDNLVENNIVMYLNIPIVFSVSSGGNVAAYNFVDDAVQLDTTGWNTAGIRGHCSYPYMELVEGNFANQGAMDNVHGGSGYMTFYRNYFSGQRTSFESSGNNFALDFQANNLYMNAVGNVLWTPGSNGSVETCNGNNALYHLGSFDAGNCEPSDDRVTETLLRHGNFDFISNAVQWDPSIDDHNLPPSLYLTAKPEFFGDLAWPPVDPEAGEPLGVLPAKQRYQTEFAP